MKSEPNLISSGGSSYGLLIRALEWSSAWGGPAAEWFGTVLPRIRAFIPVGTILEIGPGDGSWTHFLKDYCENLIVVDDEKCIEACKKRFSSYSHITYHVNDGSSLEMIPDRSIDFVFSFDSLVHADADLFKAYLRQLSEKLKPNGVGFVHHSNLGMYSEFVAMARHAFPTPRSVLLERGDLIDLETPSHAENMTAKLFEEYCNRAGMQCVSQELINWFNKHLIACLSVFTLKDSVWARPNRILENTQFMDEVKLIRTRSQLYSDLPYFECFHDGANPDLTWGWAWDKHNRNTQVAVDIYDGETPIALKVMASKYRADITAYTKDDGCHAFEYELPHSLKDGRPHRIIVKISGTDISAYNSPKVITASRKPLKAVRASSSTFVAGKSRR